MHLLHEVCRAEEHAPETLSDLPVTDPYLFAQNKDLKILPCPSLTLAPPQDKMVLDQEHIHPLPEGPEMMDIFKSIIWLVRGTHKQGRGWNQLNSLQLAGEGYSPPPLKDGVITLEVILVVRMNEQTPRDPKPSRPFWGSGRCTARRPDSTHRCR